MRLNYEVDALELAGKLRALQEMDDKEKRHGIADDLLLEYIGSEAVTQAFNELPKWYA